MIPSGNARVAGVVGWPIGHSRSPRLHGHWLDRYGIDGAYVPLAVRPENLARALRALPALGFCGVNVTVPHKEMAFALVDRPSARARRVGAVNTVTVADDGTLQGDTTDGFGFLESLVAAVPDGRALRAPAAVVGVGGAARAIVAALLDAGVPEVRLTNRTGARAEALARDLGGAIMTVPWEARADALAGAGLLVNATTLGMAGQPPLDLSPEALPAEAVVADIVYTPLRTPLLEAAAARGLATVDGLGMLLHQARPGFAAWFGVDPEVDERLRRAVLDDTEAGR